MTVKKIVGSTPSQAPRNRDLGKVAFQNTPCVAPPASATAAGETGQVACDGSYAYFCTAPNTWKRVAIAAW